MFLVKPSELQSKTTHKSKRYDWWEERSEVVRVVTVYEMVKERVKLLPAKTEDTNFIPRTHIVED